MQSQPSSFLFVLGSTRRNGNSEALARRAAAALPESVEQEWIRLTDHPLPPFEDVRHTGTGIYKEPEGNARVLWQSTRKATDLVIVSPLYWYSLSASVKLYLDHWSGWMRVPGTDFVNDMRGKTMWGVTAYASVDAALADPLVGTLRNCADYLGMRWGGVLLANGTKPGQVLDDPAALDRAADFFAREGTAVLPSHASDGS
ncbi:NAD(P)H-dependent oxidoreductase [Streptomyces sp. NPDC051172]|uniref:flavodoxin family protein n=1 Tax=Streptomyces sp. NPDC051172 TaxID=3155796 RepID=UPI003425266A